MNKYKNITVIISIILLTGFVGGIGRYCSKIPDASHLEITTQEAKLGMQTDNDSQESVALIDSFLFKCLILGIIASGVIPLFLNIISSDLLNFDDNDLRPKKLLIFASLCLIASLYSESFLERAYYSTFSQLKDKVEKVEKKYEKVENKVENVDSVAKEAKKNADFALDTEVENIGKMEINTQEANNKIDQLSTDFSLDDEEKKIATEIIHQNVIYQKDLILKNPNAAKTLKDLEAKGILEKYSTKKGTIIKMKEPNQLNPNYQP